MTQRLFVPLNTKAFEWFKTQGKTYELRSYGMQWTEKHIYPNRSVELRKGYSGESLWGTIGKIVTGNINEIYLKIDFHNIIPLAQNTEDAIKISLGIMGNKPKYIAFEIQNIHIEENKTEKEHIRDDEE